MSYSQLIQNYIDESYRYPPNLADPCIRCQGIMMPNPCDPCWSNPLLPPPQPCGAMCPPCPMFVGTSCGTCPGGVRTVSDPVVLNMPNGPPMGKFGDPRDPPMLRQEDFFPQPMSMGPMTQLPFMPCGDPCGPCGGPQCGPCGGPQCGPCGGPQCGPCGRPPCGPPCGPPPCKRKRKCRSKCSCKPRCKKGCRRSSRSRSGPRNLTIPCGNSESGCNSFVNVAVCPPPSFPLPCPPPCPPQPTNPCEHPWIRGWPWITRTWGGM